MTKDDPNTTSSTLEGQKDNNRHRGNKPSTSTATVTAAKPSAHAANVELHVHELMALLSCFILPVIGTWLLHALRAKLSRPSEGLLSNYNLTIFILASEVRPFSHLLRMIQARTLFLQRVVALENTYRESSSSSSEDDDGVHVAQAKYGRLSLSRRLEELEAYVAKTAPSYRLSLPDPLTYSQSNPDPEEQSPPTAQITSQSRSPSPHPYPDPYPSSHSPQKTQEGYAVPLTSHMSITDEIRKTMQPELDSLSRAIRRYERRSALANYQTEIRFQRLETRMKSQNEKDSTIQSTPSHSHSHSTSFSFLAGYMAPFRPQFLFQSKFLLELLLILRILLSWTWSIVTLPIRAGVFTIHLVSLTAGFTLRRIFKLSQKLGFDIGNNRNENGKIGNGHDDDDMDADMKKENMNNEMDRQSKNKNKAKTKTKSSKTMLNESKIKNNTNTNTNTDNNSNTNKMKTNKAGAETVQQTWGTQEARDQALVQAQAHAQWILGAGSGYDANSKRKGKEGNGKEKKAF